MGVNHTSCSVENKLRLLSRAAKITESLSSEPRLAAMDDAIDPMADPIAAMGWTTRGVAPSVRAQGGLSGNDGDVCREVGRG